MTDETARANTYEGITLVPRPSRERLNDRQVVDYRNEREACIQWLLALGKTPKKGEGYARGTVKPRSHRMDAFYRWVWDEQDGYTTDVGSTAADAYLRYLAGTDDSDAHKANCQKAVQMLLKWRHHERGTDEWEPDIRFSSGSGTTAPRDYLTSDERVLVREAALEAGSVPGYKSLTPSERDRWKAYLAQRFGKPKSEVSPDDWERANGWKIPSIVWTSLDAGLRPIEVKRSVVQWVDLDNDLLRIPKEDSSKNRDNWRVSVQSKTTNLLERWLEQRATMPKYDDTDALWLTRFSNPYESHSLCDLLRRLCDTAGIETETRDISWYSLRHSTGTYMTREEDLAAAQAQLRHKSTQTTMKYDQTPPEDRQDALDRMG